MRGAQLLILLGISVISWPAVAGPKNLNDSTRSVVQADVAPLGKDDKVPFETVERDGVSVSYNLQHRDDGIGPMYRLVLIMRNDTDSPIDFAPKVTLVDGAGLIARQYDYFDVRSLASVLLATSGMSAPPIPGVRTSASRTYEGTITSTASGQTYSYKGNSRPAGSFSSSFAEGYAVGAAGRARREAKSALSIIGWADSYWIQNVDSVPAGAGVSGAIMLRSGKKPVLPLRLKVDVAGRQFEFLTAAK